MHKNYGIWWRNIFVLVFFPPNQLCSVFPGTCVCPAWARPVCRSPPTLPRSPSWTSAASPPAGDTPPTTRPSSKTTFTKLTSGSPPWKSVTRSTRPRTTSASKVTTCALAQKRTGKELAWWETNLIFNGLHFEVIWNKIFLLSQGDSGGPLHCNMGDGQWYLAGITSFGSGCAKPGFPDVFTRITSFTSWIRQAITKHATLFPIPKHKTWKNSSNSSLRYKRRKKKKKMRKKIINRGAKKIANKLLQLRRSQMWGRWESFFRLFNTRIAPRILFELSSPLSTGPGVVIFIQNLILSLHNLRNWRPVRKDSKLARQHKPKPILQIIHTHFA